MDSHNQFVQRKFNEVAKLVSPKSKILDIGCHDAKIKSFFDDPNYFGIDGDKKLIQDLSKKGFQVKQVDLNKQEMPFEKEEFDYVLLLDILEHVANPSKLLTEAKKKLNNSGKLIITLPNDYHLLNKIRFVFNKPLTEDPFAPYGHMHYFPIKLGKDFLLKHDLKIIKKINLPPVKPSFVPQPIKNILAKIFPQSFVRDVLYLLEPLN